MAAPLVDEENPFYCPTISPGTYLKFMRRKLIQHGQRSESDAQANVATLLFPFSRALERMMRDRRPAKDNNYSGALNSKAYFGRSRTLAPSQPDLMILDIDSSSARPRSSSIDAFSSIKNRTRYLTGGKVKRRKTSGLDSLYVDPSMEESVEPRRLDYHNSVAPSPGAVLQVGMAGTCGIAQVGFDMVSETGQFKGVSPKDLATLRRVLDAELPGIRLGHRLASLKDQSTQGYADFLGFHGYLTPAILTILKPTNVECLSLFESLSDSGGLNIAGVDALSVFGHPGGFSSLAQLTLNGTSLQDEDLVHIHHLPQLSVLLLRNTSIGNEAVFLLVSLKHTLVQLSIADNPDIDDQAVPALVVLHNLAFLSIFNTSIEMPGLRLFARTMLNEGRSTDVEMPRACQVYLDSLETEYLVEVHPPLISNPSLCGHLSSVALKRNLVAHASQNSAIVTSGSKPEMAERLFRILKTREDDLLIQEMCDLE